jgi:glucose-1-phosphate cytidylyltransferase
MKCVILAGGLGTRLSEETVTRPKPMVEIGGKPILWHLMKIYSAHGINEFIICAGYRGYFIKEYFANYFLHTSDITFDVRNNSIKVHSKGAEPWRVTVVDTGESTMTGGRLRRVAKFLDDTAFCMTYGDGLGDVPIDALIKHHRDCRKLATLTAVQPAGRFGALNINGSTITGFIEKPQGDGGWINGGFFVLEKRVIDLIPGDSTIWEREPLQNLAARDQLAAFKHSGFWQPMDTLRDKLILEELWTSGKAPWQLWA